MKSIVYKNPHEIVVEQKPVPEIAAGEVLVKVAYVGVCGTDMFIYQGAHPRAKAPLIMGHEFSGTIVKGHPTLPEGRRWRSPAVSYGRCEPRLSGHGHVCGTLRLVGIDRGGTIAEYVEVAGGRMVEVPRDRR